MLSAELSLAAAIENNDTELTRTHILEGIDPNAPIEGGLPPLHLAAFAGQVEIGKLLIDLGANVNGSASLTDVHGPKPLHVAVSRGQLAFVELLLQRWADPNLRDSLQQTPLDIAVGKAAVLEHRQTLIEDTQKQQKHKLELEKTRSIQTMLRDHGGKTTAEVEQDKLDAKIRTHENDSLLNRSTRSLEKSKSNSVRTKRPSEDDPQKTAPSVSD